MSGNNIYHKKNSNNSCPCSHCKPEAKKDKVKVVILDNNPISIAGYIEEYGDIFEDKELEKLVNSEKKNG